MDEQNGGNAKIIIVRNIAILFSEEITQTMRKNNLFEQLHFSSNQTLHYHTLLHITLLPDNQTDRYDENMEKLVNILGTRNNYVVIKYLLYSHMVNYVKYVRNDIKYRNKYQTSNFHYIERDETFVST